MRRNVPEDILTKYKKVGDCWIYTGKVNSRYGYGIFCMGRKEYRAHRISWIAAHGEIPGELHVLHKCDVRNCINPEHLYLGTERDNSRDKVERNRQARGETTNNTPLSESDVIRIRELKSDGMSDRDIARLYSIDRRSVGQIWRRRRWRHVVSGPQYVRLYCKSKNEAFD